MRELRIDKLSETILDIIRVVKGEIKTTKFNYYDYIFTSFLKRHVYILYGINELLPRYKENNNLIIALSPLLRMGLSDFISQCYILSSVTANGDFHHYKKEYEKRVEQILFSPISIEINRLEKQKLSKGISNEEYKRNIRAAYKVAKIGFSSFNEDTLEYELKVKNEINPSKMFRVFSENKKFKQYRASYALYDYYSKMEHFGGFSNVINGIGYKNEMESINRLIHSIILITKGIEFCIQNISVVNENRILKDLENIAYNYLISPLKKCISPL